MVESFISYEISMDFVEQQKMCIWRKTVVFPLPKNYKNYTILNDCPQNPHIILGPTIFAKTVLIFSIKNGKHSLSHYYNVITFSELK